MVYRAVHRFCRRRLARQGYSNGASIAGFRLLNGGARLVTFLAIPVLTFAAPFIIMRNTIRGRRLERRRFEFAMMATVLAGIWSLMSGTVVVAAFNALTQLFA